MKRCFIKSNVSAHKFVVEPFAAAHSRKDALTALRTLRTAKKHCARSCGNCAWRKNIAHDDKAAAHSEKTLRMALRTLRIAFRTFA